MVRAAVHHQVRQCLPERTNERSKIAFPSLRFAVFVMLRGPLSYSGNIDVMLASSSLKASAGANDTKTSALYMRAVVVD